MADDQIHKPELPGVKTLPKDTEHTRAADGDLGITFLGKGGRRGKDHLPEDLNMFKPLSGNSFENKKNLFDVGQAIDEAGHEVGTIVTDKKHHRGSFKSLLSDAFDEWWEKTSGSFEKTFKKFEVTSFEKPATILPPEARKQVIEAAAQHARQVPRDDHAVIVEKLKTLARDAEKATGKPYEIQNASTRSNTSFNAGATQKRDVPPSTSRNTLGKGTYSVQPLPALDLRKVAVAPTVVTHRTEEQKRPPAREIPIAPAQKTERAAVVVLPPDHHPIQRTDTPTKEIEVGVVPEVKKVENKRFEMDDSITKQEFVSKSELPRDEAVGTSWTFFMGKNEKEARDLRAAPSAPETPRPPVQPRVPIAVPFQAPPEPAQKPLPSPSVAPLVREMFDAPAKETEMQLTEEPLIQPTIRVRQAAPPPTVTRTWAPLIRSALLVLVIIIGTSLGVFAAIYTVGRMADDADNTEVAKTVPVPSFFTAVTQLAVPLQGSRSELLGALDKMRETAPSGAVQFYPTIVGSQNRPATTEEIVSALALRTEGSFVRSLDPMMMLGSIFTTKNEPFIIVRSSSFDVAFAGMLDWEPFMSDDLTPFFGPRVERSLNPMTGALGSAKFVDALRNNRSIRILYGEAGEERIIYGFVNRNVIVITTSTAALSAVLSSIQ